MGSDNSGASTFWKKVLIGFLLAAYLIVITMISPNFGELVGFHLPIVIISYFIAKALLLKGVSLGYWNAAIITGLAILTRFLTAQFGFAMQDDLYAFYAIFFSFVLSAVLFLCIKPLLARSDSSTNE
ncbi:hypothetical protein [Alcanivorax sp. 1008]|uniref:hypothetical protein n=1 Tax=Alcanivorax sp. 1008 TaxID=2816853 RepID=UPI001DF61B7B|nr:hypothetical protein [Alcanivorax sp. 1008]MCC1498046.1 hypothetical protein [Alcanivorax sp. 1008]